jgi:hypothetical protein
VLDLASFIKLPIISVDCKQKQLSEKEGIMSYQQLNFENGKYVRKLTEYSKRTELFLTEVNLKEACIKD